MKTTLCRRAFALRTALIALAVAAGFQASGAQAFPDKPITLYVGFAAGGGADVVARALADEMSKSLGQRVIVDNKTGASGNVATTTVLNAPADGHSLLFAAINLATNPALIGVKYDPKADLAMVSQVTSVPVVMLASGKGTLKSPAEVVDASRKAPGGLKVGSGGIGTSSHLAVELFARSQGIPYVHVPYRGGSPANLALISGEIDLMFDLMSGSLRSFVDAATIRPLAVMQENRLEALPKIKSAKEWGLPASTYIRSWQGIAVRAGTPKAVVEKLHKAVVDASNTPGFRARVWQLGSEIVTSRTPEAFQQHYLAELDRWAALVKTAGIKAE